MQAKGFDSATQSDGSGTGNLSAGTTETFIIDFVAPTGAITLPATNSFTNSLPLITGTASDDLAGVKNVKLYISSGTGGGQVWWNGASWQGSAILNTATMFASSWTFTSPTWATGQQFFLQAVVTDNALNTFTTAASTFTFYTTAPTVTVSTPLLNGFYGAVQVSTPFGGTATSLPPNAPGISTVTLTLEDLDSGPVSYFNGTSFVTSLSSVAAQGTVNVWTYNNPNIVLINDHRYTLIAKATDNAGNTGTSSTVQFVYDIKAPTTTITSPLPGFTNNWTVITGTGSDKVGGILHASGVSATGVQVAVEQLFNSKWWFSGDLAFDGSNPDWGYFTVTNTSTTNPNTWTTTLPGAFSSQLVSGTSYYIVSLSTDVAGNAEFGPLAANIPAGTGVIATYSIVAPTATITLPHTGLAGIESLPTLSGTSSGLVAVSTVQVALQNLTNGLWMNSVNYSFSVTQSSPNFIPAQGTVNNWTFTAGGALNTKLAGDTKYSLVTQATDVAGNVQSVYALNTSSTTFLMDRQAPNAPVIALPASGGSYQPTALGHIGNGSGLRGTDTDPGTHPSGISQVQMQLYYLVAGTTYYWDGTQVQFSSTPVTTWDNSGAGTTITSRATTSPGR